MTVPSATVRSMIVPARRGDGGVLEALLAQVELVRAETSCDCALRVDLAASCSVAVMMRF